MKLAKATVMVVMKGTGCPWRRVWTGVMKPIRPVYCSVIASDPRAPSGRARELKG